MNKLKLVPAKSLLSAAVAMIAMGGTAADASVADGVTNALTGGTAYGDFRLRYEGVDQKNTADDANALTLRTRLGYNTGSYEGFSATVEMEDSRVVAGQDSYELHPKARPSGYTVKGKSVVADSKTTELDQSFLQYKTDGFTAKVGRQVLTYDNQRFIGHVGWRQDRQTYDAVSFNYKPLDDLSISYAFLDQRNRIFGEEADINSKDHLLNIGYQTGVGKLSTYAYLLEVDDNTKNSLDTYGLRFNGAQKADFGKLLYTLEYAYQENDKAKQEDYADYFLVEGGVVIEGVTAKLGYESLGSKDGTYAFSTPLATGHKFNGWADQFLGTPKQGLVDMYVSLSGKLAGGKLVFAYHDYAADDSKTPADDLGREYNLLYAKKFTKNYSAGVKYANYTAGDTAVGKVDTDKLWVWVGAKF